MDAEAVVFGYEAGLCRAVTCDFALSGLRRRSIASSTATVIRQLVSEASVAVKRLPGVDRP